MNHKLRFVFSILVQLCYSKLSAQEYWVYVSSYSDSSNVAGISTYDYGNDKIALNLVAQEFNVPASSYLAIDKKGQHLYSINKSGIQVFSIDKTTGKLNMLDSREHVGSGACYVSLSKKEDYLLVAYYGSGSIASYKIDSTGIGSQLSVIKHTGSSINPERQSSPHAHMITQAPFGDLVYVTDLGVDKVFTYSLSSEGHLSEAPVSITIIPSGFGPRHLSFHPTKKVVYVLAELTGNVLAYTYHPDTGIVSLLNEISILPKNFDQFNKAADIHLAGKYLYASNRGANNLAICKIKPNGKLKLIGFNSTDGDWPRAFEISPSGKQLIVANKRSNTLCVYDIKKNGSLTFKYKAAAPINPQCIRFVKK